MANTQTSGSTENQSTSKRKRTESLWLRFMRRSQSCWSAKLTDAGFLRSESSWVVSAWEAPWLCTPASISTRTWEGCSHCQLSSTTTRLFTSRSSHAPATTCRNWKRSTVAGGSIKRGIVRTNLLIPFQPSETPSSYLNGAARRLTSWLDGASKVITRNSKTRYTSSRRTRWLSLKSGFRKLFRHSKAICRTNCEADPVK